MKTIKLLLFFLFSIGCLAQVPEKWNTTEIHEQIKKLNFLGSVLYVAAHPDDENTKLISYFSNHYHAKTAYLSLTRGDGGQNLIGKELREELGVIRTQELLAARKIDGGQQFFSRANDFGFSKNPTETFTFWSKEQVLEDMLQVIETFQPDIVINRFNHRTPGTTHGHHTASAMLSLEAFQKTKFQPKRLFFNTSWWFYGSQEAFEKADKSNFFTIDANVYFSALGKSNSEIAARSRSQHQCQGFGTIGTRGEEKEYLELLEGTMPTTNNIFEGIDTTWNRIKGGKEIGAILYPIETNFNFQNPEKHIPQLVKAYKLLQKTEDSHWKKVKLVALSKIIAACSGLFLEATSNVESTTKSDSYSLNLETINRSNSEIKLLSVEYASKKLAKNSRLENNIKQNFTIENCTIPEEFNYSNKFWLREQPTEGMYVVSNKAIRIYPEETLEFPVVFSVEIEGEKIDFVKNVIYKKNLPNYGETYIPFTVLPEITTSIENKVAIFTNTTAKEIAVKITAETNNIKGTIALEIAENWKIEPNEIAFEIDKKNEDKTVFFTIFPPEKEAVAIIKTIVTYKEKTYNQEKITIDYSHIPKQTILQETTAKMVKLDLKADKKQKIGYINGAGDSVAENLEQMGFAVTVLDIATISSDKLQDFDAIVLGIRVFNVEESLVYKNKILFEYVENGGNLIVQYNTNSRLVTPNIAPFDLQIGRERVTNENAIVGFLQPNHAVLNTPNQITAKDFEGWVQERGLYFPTNFDANFTAILEMHDADESPNNGALLIAKYGKGNYIYTGLSFFRQLPAGVPGAYRLFANLIAL